MSVIQLPSVDLTQPVNWLDPLNEGLVAWHLIMPGNNGGGVLIDITKHGHDGVLVTMDPAVDWRGTNRVSGLGSLKFDGSNNHVLIDHALVDGTPLTMTCWFKADNATDTMTAMVVQAAGSNAVVARMLIRGSIGGDPVQAQHQNGGSSIASSSTGFTANNWHHAANVFFSDSDRRAYVDGGSEGTNLGARTAFSTLNLTVIAGTDGSGASFPGELDDLRFWNRALSAEEIREVYQDSRSGYQRTLNFMKLPVVIAAAPPAPETYLRRYEGAPAPNTLLRM